MNTEQIRSLPDLMTAKELQSFLRISRASVYNLMNAEGFPTIHIGCRKMVDKAKLLEWIEQNTNGARSFTL